MTDLPTRTTRIPDAESTRCDDHVLQAVLWDFDGTLADSEHLWMNAEYDLVPSLGGAWTDEQARGLVGNSLIDSAKIILAAIGRDDIAPEWIVDELTRRVVHQLETGPIPWRPGALELLEQLRAESIPCALVSASYRVMLDAVLRRLPEGTFATVVAGDEVSSGKPDPEPYLAAARTLGVDPHRCVVLEDSNPGATSGNAAGAVVLAVRNMVTIHDAPRRVHRTTLAGVDSAALRLLLAEANADTRSPAGDTSA